MREVILTKNGALKINQGTIDLIKGDYDCNFSAVNGEIVRVVNSKNNQSYIGSIEEINNNLNVYVINRFEKDFLLEKFVDEKIKKSYLRKSRIFGKNFRLVHGVSDDLPGLIVDSYENCNLIQINLSYLDKLRENIKRIVTEITGKDSFILADDSMRSKSNLPIYDVDKIPDFIEVIENNVLYKISSEIIQKNGYYFDHRINREKAKNIADQYITDQKITALDLFSYVGSWGLNLLKSQKINDVIFVDQGDFENSINTNLAINKVQGKFIRNDVFNFLDEEINQNKKYKLISCDPPAFCKSIAKKKNAIEGYRKLINKLIKLLADEGIIFIGSCTQYVYISELMEIVSKEAFNNNSKAFLIDIGTQGFDHSNDGFGDRSNYIKFLAYKMEKK